MIVGDESFLNCGDYFTYLTREINWLLISVYEFVPRGTNLYFRACGLIDFRQLATIQFTLSLSKGPALLEQVPDLVYKDQPQLMLHLEGLFLHSPKLQFYFCRKWVRNSCLDRGLCSCFHPDTWEDPLCNLLTPQQISLEYTSKKQLG